MDYTKLIETVKKEHLCSIEFTDEAIILKKQMGNNTGSIIEIEISNTKRIQSIKFIPGSYNEPNTVKRDFNKILDLIINA